MFGCTDLQFNCKSVLLVMVPRALSDKLVSLARSFPVISLTGPRKSGKMTLVKKVFADLPYVSLENPDDREFALEDPRHFLDQFDRGAVLDEVQRTPKLFSYLQGIVDQDPQKQFVLTGSHNFLLMEAITQSLAGRVGILKLLPFSIEELSRENLVSDDYSKVLFKGFYPPVYDREIPARDFFPSYLQTYVERDVRQITQVRDLTQFSNFLRICAGRAGQQLNLSEMANVSGVSVNTVKSWLSILEASFILFRLLPHYKNFNKRLTKMPKLYFYDTGLLCYLLGIEKAEQVRTHYALGALFENLVIGEVVKAFHHRGEIPPVYYWRDHRGKEVDLIIEKAGRLTPIEIKAGRTRSLSYFDGLNYWNKLSGNDPENSFVVYGGLQSQTSSKGKLLSWQELGGTNFSSF